MSTAHPNVKLFITHGGLHSIEEAVYNEKPLIGIPFFADQLTNMRLVEKIGYGKLVPYNQITEESLGKAVEEVLSNPAYVLYLGRILYRAVVYSYFGGGG